MSLAVALVLPPISGPDLKNQFTSTQATNPLCRSPSPLSGVESELSSMEKSASDAGSSIRAVGGDATVMGGQDEDLAGVGSSFPEIHMRQGDCFGDDEKGDCEKTCADVQSVATSGWTRRVRIGKAPSAWAINPDKKSGTQVINKIIC